MSPMSLQSTKFKTGGRSEDDLRNQYNHKRNYTGPPRDQLSRVKRDVIQLWQKMSVVDPSDLENIQRSIIKHATSTLARTVFNVDNFAAYQATAHSVRDFLIERWNVTQQTHTLKDPKRVYYMSLEFLLGRSLDNALLNLKVKEKYGTALQSLGFRMEDLIPEEEDAALGNGGLGRLAACYMDSLACLEYPAWGYGLRYTYGIFKQHIVDGHQTEFPDYWLNYGNPWEVPRLDVVYEVRFYGHCTRYTDALGSERWKWEGGDKVQAVAYDVPIPGYNNHTCLNIRLWSSKPTKQFDLSSFNAGNYEKSVEEQQRAENITSILYPNDNHNMGKELRLKQQYFLVCATLKDVIRRFKKTNRPWADFPDQVAVQLNDTHPTLAAVELQRRLVDLEGLEWDEAWDVVTRTFAFTNHTVLPEALETWPVPLLTELLPRHMAIIFDINLYFLQQVEKKFPNDRDRLRRMSIIEETTPQRVRMAHLAVIASHTVNGVAALHSALVKSLIFKDFAEFFGDAKFTNVTNGITPRRWLNQANPPLAALITQLIGGGWHKDLGELKKLAKFADDAKVQEQWRAVKLHNKQRLAELIHRQSGLTVSPDALFDVQVKRIHEYKRQLMNILGVIHRYFSLKRMTEQQRQRDVVPRVVVFGGKAAPGYYMAKLVILLINNVAKVVNNDPEVNKYLQVSFIYDYNVSLAEIIVPASDISQHISTAGTEASGTSNMKFVLNGGLIVGTVDGANIEIGDEIGKDNIYFFGALAHEVEDIRHAQRYRQVKMDPKLEAVLAVISSGQFDTEPPAATVTGTVHGPAGTPSASPSPTMFLTGPGTQVVAPPTTKQFGPLIQTLTTGGDFYLLSHDFSAYLDALAKADAEFRDTKLWTRKSILATAGMGHFSSDRSVAEYARRIWHIEPCPMEAPETVASQLAAGDDE
ncbi:Non-essential glycogen phosphorylase [Blastocladiella emersonii ATCC 22665]|nr:Non-essential glycogen phosphorylase [Blastocladiella emersonii ATCC 22665]